MIAAVLQLAAFLATAWLLSRGVDRCYRRNEPAPLPPVPVPRGGRPPGPPAEPTSAPPVPTPTPTWPLVGSRS
jgi:hypothetical protein